MFSRLFAVVAGGGTGGHVTPALAIGEAMVAAGHEHSEVEFSGGRRGIEGRLVPEAGFRLHRLPGRGIQRRLTGENVSACLGLAAGVLMALGLAIRRRPRVVVSVGGYAGFPFAAAALVLRIPLMMVSVDAAPGAVNRLLGRYAALNAVAFDTGVLPRSVVTGVPLRRGVLEISRDETERARTLRSLGVQEGRRLVVAVGGSLGAGSINAAVLALAAAWAARGDLAIYHLAGERNEEQVRTEAAALGLSASATSGRLQYLLAGFEPRLGVLLAGCDLAVSRAGGITVAELGVLGVPSVLVPLPGAPHDHQTKNAAVLEERGAAVAIADGDLDATTLAAAISSCFDDPGRLDAMAAAATALARRDAAEQVAQLAETLAVRSPREETR